MKKGFSLTCLVSAKVTEYKVDFVYVIKKKNKDLSVMHFNSFIGTYQV